MPDESYPVSFRVDLGNLPQDVTDIKTAVGTPAAGTTLATAVQGLATQTDVTNAVQGLATQTDVTNAARGLATQTDVTNAVRGLATQTDVTNAVRGLATQTDVTNAVRGLATNEDILHLRWLVLKLWWLDHLCRDLADTGPPKSFPATVAVPLKIRDPDDLAKVTTEHIGELVEKLDEQFRLPPKEQETLLGALRAFSAHWAGQQPSPPSSTTTTRDSTRGRASGPG